jgi:septal ring-binding cell division protein DamX
MELMCPHCHTNNRVESVGAADSARFVCAGCGTQFEAMLVEGALVPVLPREGSVPFGQAPADDFFDILSIPQEPLAEPAAAQSQVLEDVFVGAADFEPVVPQASPAPAEIDPFHITEEAAEHAAPPAAVAAADEAEAEPAPAEPTPAKPASVAPPPRPAVDKYAVGMRVLRISPMWLLLSSVGFFAVLLTMSWLSQPVVPVGEAVAQLPNQATSPATQPAAVAQVEQAKATAEQSLPPKPRASAEQPATESAAPAAEAAPAAPQPASAESPAVSSGRGNYTVQVGSFNNPSEANEHVSRLRGAGFEARAVAVELPKRGTWYRVQAGRFETRDEAAKAGAQLRAKGLAAAALVAEVN